MFSMFKNLNVDKRKTESRAYISIDRIPTSFSIALQLLSHAWASIAVLPETFKLSESVRKSAEILKKNSDGRIVYVGAGTSGRLGVQDGVELIPTFRWSSARLAFLMAGGTEAFLKAVEGAEDDEEKAKEQVRALNISMKDIVIGVAASGSTPYTCAAIEEARSLGALTIGFANNKRGRLLKAAHYAFGVEVGAELVAGSSRLKAGTAQKTFLNTFSTQLMIELHKVFNGYMVDVLATNKKLERRSELIVSALTQSNDFEKIKDALKQTDGHVKKSILVVLGMSVSEATEALQKNEDNLLPIIQSRAPHLV